MIACIRLISLEVSSMGMEDICSSGSGAGSGVGDGVGSEVGSYSGCGVASSYGLGSYVSVCPQLAKRAIAVINKSTVKIFFMDILLPII